MVFLVGSFLSSLLLSRFHFISLQRSEKKVNETNHSPISHSGCHTRHSRILHHGFVFCCFVWCVRFLSCFLFITLQTNRTQHTTQIKHMNHSHFSVYELGIQVNENRTKNPKLKEGKWNEMNARLFSLWSLFIRSFRFFFSFN